MAMEWLIPVLTLALGFMDLPGRSVQLQQRAMEVCRFYWKYLLFTTTLLRRL